jgi:hypothetical protein
MDLIRGPLAADKAEMQGPFVLCLVLFWASLMRALFVKAQLLPATCARCGLRFERRGLGEPVCRCHGHD